jgi:predicted ABC-type ATPase
MNKTIIIIAGPNGAGKTTFAREFLPQEANCPRFLNADLIAAGLSPFDPDAASIKAARLMLEEMADCTRNGESFAFETTLSGRTYARLIPAWQRAGYQVVLFFLELSCEEIAIARVADRVAQGGHHIPTAVIRRRFAAGKTNFHELYKPLANAWRHYDTSGETPLLLASSDTR